MNKGISIIICCYNSRQKLPNTLKYLALQKVPASLSYEIIVVDNASTDNTAEFALSFWKGFKTSVPLYVVHESTPGLVYARICGTKAAQYELLLFCDDDNWLREDYIQNAVDIMNADPKIGVLGGQSTLAPNIEAPSWWDEQQGNYAVGKQLQQTGYANERGFLYGAGLVTRKKLAEKIFDSEYPLLLTGRKGEQCLSGEDWEYCQRALLLDYDLYYSEKLFYWHDVSTSRLTQEKLRELLHSFELGKNINERYEYVRKYNHKAYFYKILLLFKCIFMCIWARPKYKKRKLESLRFQTRVCGFNFIHDAELSHILGWVNKYTK